MANRKSRRHFLGNILRTGGVGMVAPTAAVRRTMGFAPEGLSVAQPAAAATRRIYVDNGVPSVAVDEAVLFPFDDHSIPFTKGLVLSLVRGSKSPGDYVGHQLRSRSPC